MYWARFTRRGDVVAEDDLEADNLTDAITEADILLEKRRNGDQWDGFEIWDDGNRLYKC